LSVARPGVADDPPALGDQRASRLCLDMDAGACDQRRDHVIVVGRLDLEEGLGVVERDRLDRRPG
jgi:hypothetical protein